EAGEGPGRDREVSPDARGEVTGNQSQRSGDSPRGTYAPGAAFMRGNEPLGHAMRPSLARPKATPRVMALRGESQSQLVRHLHQCRHTRIRKVPASPQSRCRRARGKGP